MANLPIAPIAGESLVQVDPRPTLMVEFEEEIFALHTQLHTNPGNTKLVEALEEATGFMQWAGYVAGEEASGGIASPDKYVAPGPVAQPARDIIEDVIETTLAGGRAGKRPHRSSHPNAKSYDDCGS
jgi:hypothetical protein